jgi:circadian clock protein KaiB
MIGDIVNKTEDPHLSGDMFDETELPSRQIYVLRLYVAGMTSKSQEAIRNITGLCEKHLKDRYELEVIDIYQQPELAKGEELIATPTLIKKLPVPLRKFIGTMTNEQKILVGLDLQSKKDQ